jgi:hypothetical protein
LHLDDTLLKKSQNMIDTQLHESLLPLSLSVLVMGYIHAVLQDAHLSACILLQGTLPRDHHGFLSALHCPALPAEDLDTSHIFGCWTAAVRHTILHCCAPILSLLSPCTLSISCSCMDAPRILQPFRTPAIPATFSHPSTNR